MDCAQSWLSAFQYVVILLVFNLYGAGNNTFIFFLGFGFFMYNFGVDQWLRKLLRLGVRMIRPKREDEGVEHQNSVKFDAKPDNSINFS